MPTGVAYFKVFRGNQFLLKIWATNLDQFFWHVAGACGFLRLQHGRRVWQLQPPGRRVAQPTLLLCTFFSGSLPLAAREAILKSRVRIGGVGAWEDFEGRRGLFGSGRGTNRPFRSLHNLLMPAMCRHNLSMMYVFIRRLYRTFALTVCTTCGVV